MENVQVHAGQLTQRITDERIARMIVWLMRKQSEFANVERGRVEFDFAGTKSPSIKARVTTNDDV